MPRRTEQREAIRTIIFDSRRPLSSREVLHDASALVPGLGIATVYRAIRAMIESGEVATVDLPGEATHYERADLPHHHHFKCAACGRVFDVAGCVSDIHHGLPAGFEVDHHLLCLYGRCDVCATEAARV